VSEDHAADGSATAPQEPGQLPGQPKPGRLHGREVSPLWHNAGFLKLWAGQSISLLGSSVTALALPLTAILTLHAGAAQIGILKSLQWLPWIFVSLWVGAWSDRHRRRPIMIAANAGQVLLLCSIVGLALGHELSLGYLYFAGFALGTMAVCFGLAYSAYVPFIAGRDLLVPANARLQGSASVATIAGPGLGGVLVELLTAPVALVADAASFVVSAVSLLWIHDVEPAPDRPAVHTGVIARIRVGLELVFKDPLLRALVGTSGFFNLFIQWIGTLLVLFMVDDLRLSPGIIGLMVSCQSVGALTGSLLSSRASRRFGIGRAIMGAVVCECLVMLAAPFAPARHPVYGALVIGAVLFINGMGSTLSGIIGTSVRQAVTPQDLIGRMSAAFSFVGYGVVAIGSLCGGFIAQAVGLRMGILIGAIGIQATIVWMALSALPKVRELPKLPAAPEQPAGTLNGDSQETAAKPRRSHHVS
jgi:MFS family permease